MSKIRLVFPKDYCRKTNEKSIIEKVMKRKTKKCTFFPFIVYLFTLRNTGISCLMFIYLSTYKKIYFTICCSSEN